MLANNALHPIENYPQEIEALGLTIKEKKNFGCMGMDFYCSILAQ